MFRPLVFFIGFRYAYNQKSDSFGRFVSWLSMIGIMLGSLGLIVVMSVMNGFENQMQKSILSFIPQAQLTTSQNKLSFTDYPLDQLPKLEGVNQITPLVTGDVILQSPGDITISTMLGIDPTQYEPIKNYLFDGELSSLQPNKYNIILGYDLANRFHVNVGDQIRLMSTSASQITPMGKIPLQRVFTVSGIFSVNNDIDQSLVYLNIEDAAKLMRYPQDTVTSWRLFLDNPLNIESLVSQDLGDDLQFHDWREKRGELFQAIKMEKSIMSLLISLIVIVAAFNIITSLSLLVMEKQNEIAILKTQGLSNRDIMLIFIIQGASSGVIGSIVGCLLGWIIAANIGAITSFLGLTLAGIRLQSLVYNQQVVIIFISLLSLSILSTLYPAYRAARIQPAEALRYE